ncbi:hypothetical protein [Microtetraspora malaysiensis]|uniref:FAD-binding domain-containing protein n=1 Tax=Microtetraspora malaysiensis TaxID=161358 RepID=A0ABW6T4R4_9ACTN
MTRFGAAFTQFAYLPGGRVEAHFADGAVKEADLLVAADGSMRGSGASSSRTPGSWISAYG